MKKITLLMSAALVAVSLSVSAQTSAGKILVGGKTDLTFSSMTAEDTYDGATQGDEESQTRFNLAPIGGYFVMDNLAIGASLPISYTSRESGNNEYSSSQFILAPFGRYYLEMDKIKPFGQLEFGFGSQSYDYGSGNDGSLSIFGFGLSAGAAFYVNESVAFEGTLGYTSMTYTNGDDDKAKTKVSGIALQIGVTVSL